VPQYPEHNKECPRCGRKMMDERVLMGKRRYPTNGPMSVIVHKDSFSAMCDDGWQPIHTHMPYPQMVRCGDKV
jgi:hypothetical protein